MKTLYLSYTKKDSRAELLSVLLIYGDRVETLGIDPSSYGAEINDIVRLCPNLNCLTIRQMYYDQYFSNYCRRLANVRTLEFARNALVDSILQDVDFNFNAMSGQCLENAPDSLTSLYIINAMFIEVQYLEALFKRVNLRCFYLHVKELVYFDLALVTPYWQEMRSLTLCCHNFRNLSTLATLKHLTTLDINVSQTEFFEFMDAISEDNQVVHMRLRLELLQINEDRAATFSKMKKLKELQLWFCTELLLKLDVYGLKHLIPILGQLTHLKHLEMTGSGTPVLSSKLLVRHLINLEHLRVYMGPDDFAPLANLCQLQKLDVVVNCQSSHFKEAYFQANKFLRALAKHNTLHSLSLRLPRTSELTLYRKTVRRYMRRFDLKELCVYGTLNAVQMKALLRELPKLEKFTAFSVYPSIRHRAEEIKAVGRNRVKIKLVFGNDTM